jgi:hypothetical protein
MPETLRLARCLKPRPLRQKALRADRSYPALRAVGTARLPWDVYATLPAPIRPLHQPVGNVQKIFLKFFAIVPLCLAVYTRPLLFSHCDRLHGS